MGFNLWREGFERLFDLHPQPMGSGSDESDVSANDDSVPAHDKLEIAKEFRIEKLPVVAVQSAFGVRGELESVHFPGTDVVVDSSAENEHRVAHYGRGVKETTGRRLRVLMTRKNGYFPITTESK